MCARKLFYCWVLLFGLFLVLFLLFFWLRLNFETELWMEWISIPWTMQKSADMKLWNSGSHSLNSIPSQRQNIGITSLYLPILSSVFITRIYVSQMLIYLLYYIWWILVFVIIIQQQTSDDTLLNVFVLKQLFNIGYSFNPSVFKSKIYFLDSKLPPFFGMLPF